MLVLVLCVVAVLSPLLAMRWPAGLALHRWAWPWLIWVAVALQALIITVELPGGVAPVVHVATYVVAGGFLWVNRHVPGLILVGLGALSNGVTIALNGGVLPTTAEAITAAGIDPDPAFSNVAVVDDPVLLWLGDIFAWPELLPLSNTFSVGDVLIVVGVGIAAWTGTRPLGSAPPPTPRHARQTRDSATWGALRRG